ncbi:MAG TPA: efflux RND transporter periplasmic adaptor subunit [Kiritimatiellia bacterium]|jgi:HlyD family secretion protein|nr:efflux RND transporter periplasmic adaptor subunit [Lentisphaerota bacterium]HOU20717.1 efflux RND transporter periplasmic adaptor subunit [Kiritimatiellia bacterium]HPC20420.1 efflux RND transporter periplasmic adaptor subunit [Kiritimatiellia bacterium]HQQ60647.1 efflux RND transporter periplasmic adaptor subunit [Kiritimatiellia bacterium]
MKTDRIALALLAAALPAALLAAGCGKKETAAAAEETAHALAVRALPAAMRDFERRLTVQGTLEAKRFAHVAARADGNLDAIWVDEGDLVTAGATALFQIDPVGRENARTIARQDLAVAKASLAVAEASAAKTEAEARKATLDYERYERLHQDGKVSLNEFEAAEVAFASAKAGIAVARAQVDLAERQVKQAEAALAIAEKNLADTKVVAPIDGVISARSAEPGEHMSVGRTILRIDDLSAVEAAAYLPAQYHPEVEPGKTVFRLGVGGRVAGTHLITYRGPTIDPTLRTFEIKGLLENAGDAAVPGQMADLTLIFEARKSLGVPSAAVLVRAGQTVVFAVRDGRAVACPVEPGLQNDGWTEILSGLEAGEMVVTEGQTQLHDGMAVEVL